MSIIRVQQKLGVVALPYTLIFKFMAMLLLVLALMLELMPTSSLKLLSTFPHLISDTTFVFFSCDIPLEIEQCIRKQLFEFVSAIESLVISYYEQVMSAVLQYLLNQSSCNKVMNVIGWTFFREGIKNGIFWDYLL